MRHCTHFDAEAHFSKLLDATLLGESCVITKNGIKVALLSPYEENEVNRPVDDAIRAIKNLRKGLFLGKELSINTLRKKRKH